MRPPFPGMDPWLEDPELWPNVHKSLVIAMRDDLAHRLRPRHFVSVVPRRTILIGADIDRVYQPEVLSQHTGRRMRRNGSVGAREHSRVKPERYEESEEVYLAIGEPAGYRSTLIEFLSLASKKSKGARVDYLRWRRDLLQSGSSFVEIDLLRGGDAMPMMSDSPPNDYRILISRAKPRRKDTVYTFAWTAPIPAIPIPLIPGEPEPVIDPNTVLHKLYQRAGYDLAIDYRRPPSPPLRREDRAWAASVVAQVLDPTPQVPARGETAT
jgi:Protein of unknown function (DUF4058)